MIIEFIGSTGAGKTTLIQHILSSCQREGINAVVGYDFVLQQNRLNGIKSNLVRLSLTNLISLFASLSTWRNNLAFYRFAIRTISKLPGTVTWFEKLYLARNILKKVGIYEILRRHGDEQQMYLMDEGTVHVAHNLFVQAFGESNIKDLATFARLVPLPHVVVYVQQDETVMIEKTLARGHNRVPDHSVAAAVHFVQQAVKVFDELVQNPAIASRVIVVDNAQNRIITLGDKNNPCLGSAVRLVQAGIQAVPANNPMEERQLAQ